jgi:hypothetical protein
MLDALCNLGFARETKGKFSGFPGQSKRTTVRAGPKLVKLGPRITAWRVDDIALAEIGIRPNEPLHPLGNKRVNAATAAAPSEKRLTPRPEAGSSTDTNLKLLRSRTAYR